jgi:hypothetical protein
MAGMAAEYGLAALEARLRALMRSEGRTPNSAGVLADGLEVELFRATAAVREAFHVEMV